jgi:sensor histidine kinase YesM
MKPIQSIQGKMVLLFLLLLIVPLAISLVYVYFRVQNSIEQTYARHQRQTAEALSVDIAKWRRQYEDLSLRIFGDSLVQQVLQEANAPEDARLSGLRSNTRTKLVQYAEYSPYIKAIYVMDNKHRVIGSTDPTAAALAGMLELTSASARLAGSPGWDSGGNDRAVTLYQQIVDNQFDLNRGIGHLFVVLDRAELFNSFQQFTLDAGQQYGMTDKSGRLRITTADDLDTALWAPSLDAGGNSSGGLTGYRLLETAKGTYVYYGIEQDDWLLATWIAEAENLKPVRSTLIVLLIISGALLLYMVVMIVFISDRITKPLRLIHRAMKRIGSGKLQLKVPVLRDDEIGQVGTTLNHMSEEIERLIDKNRIIEKKRRIIQLRTLEYQINPHFLYNTLDSVNMLSRKYDDPRIGDIVTSLSRLFRLGLNQGKETVTVAQELEHVGYYLKIQQIRFADRLSWDCTCDESIGTYRMIKFIMQPLVENSIIHGIRKKNQLGRIRITARGEERHLYFQVSDNGVGMSPLKLEQLRQSLLQEFTEDMERALTDTGFGLWNVDQRIKLHYGKDYGLELESIEGEGTTISVRLPYEEHNRIHEEGRNEA